MFPRVTHPSATPVLLRAFDLHVLSLPPAFVLSQDQTLMFKSSFPNSQVHLTRSIPILPSRARPKRSLFKKRKPGSLALLGTTLSRRTDPVPTSPKRRPRFSFFLFTCQRTEENQPLKPAASDRRFGTSFRQQKLAGTTSLQRRRR